VCTNYRPSGIEVWRGDYLEDIRETKIPFKVEVFPNDPAPIIRLGHEKAAEHSHPEWVPARFGLVPVWAKDDQVAKLGRMAYNARTETVSSKPMSLCVESSAILPCACPGFLRTQLGIGPGGSLAN
jgi:putative SOS response-associated peptidase YedK